MTLSYITSGTAVFSTTNPSPTTPAHNVGDILVCTVGIKPDTASATTPTGWTLIGSVAGGTGSTGIDTGPMNGLVYARVADGGGSDTTGAITIGSGNVAGAQVHVFRSSTVANVEIVGTAAADTTTGTPFSAAMPVDIGLSVGDMLVAIGVVPTDVGGGTQFSAETVAASGMTTVTLTEIGEWASATGQDMGAWLGYGPVVTGTSTGVATVSATAGGTTTNIAGPIILIRIREVTAKSASDTSSVAISESAALVIGISASDTSSVAISDVSTNNLSSTVTDTSSVAIADSSSIGGNGSLPSLININNTADAVEPENHGHEGPFMSSTGRLYRIFESSLASTNRPQAWYSDDGGLTWTKGANYSTTVTDLEGCWAVQYGNTIVFTANRDDTNWRLEYYMNDHPTLADTWSSHEVIETGMSSTGVEQFSAHIKRTSDEVHVYSATLSGALNQINLKRRTGTNTYTSATLIGSTSSNNCGANVIKGASDKAYIFYNDMTNHRLRYNTLDSSNTLGTDTAIDTGGTNNIQVPHSNAVYIDNGGTEWIFIAYATSSGLKLVSFSNGTLQTEETISSSAVIINPSASTNDAAVVQLAVDGTDLHIVWGDNTTGDVFYRTRTIGGTYGTTQNLTNFPGSTELVEYVYNNVYTYPGGNKVMGYTYDKGPHANDVSFPYYNEVVLATVTPKSASDTGSLAISESSAIVDVVAISASDTSAIKIRETSILGTWTPSGGTISAPWVGTATVGNVAGTAGTSATVDVSGATNGEVCWIMGTVGDAQTSAFSAPSGWSILGQTSEGTSGASSSRSVIFWKVKNSGDTTVNITWPVSAKYQFVPISWPGVDTSTPAEGLTWATHTTGSSYVTGTATPSDATRWSVALLSSRGSTTVVAWTPDAAQTERVDVINTSTPFVGLEVTDSNGTVTAASHSYTSTGQTASHGLGAIMYLIPAPASGGTPTNVYVSTPEDAAITISDSSAVDTGGGTTPINASDTAALTITESKALDASSTVTDTAALTITESKALDASSTSTDTSSVAISETAAILVTLPASDTSSVAISENIATTAGITASDTGSVAISESVTDNVSVSVSDTSSVAAADSSAITNILSASDTASISIADASSIQTGGVIDVSATDTASIAISESSAITVLINASDTAALTISDSSSFAPVAITGSDISSISIADSSTPLVQLSVTDTAAITITETRTLAVNVDVTDTAAVTITESVSSSGTVTSNDTSAISIADAANIYLTKSASDTSALVITESSSVNPVSGITVWARSGGAWVHGTVKVYHNGAWVTANVKIRQGGSWL